MSVPESHGKTNSKATINLDISKKGKSTFTLNN